MGGVTTILGDSREKLKELPDNSIDSCVTDPPYALVSIGKRFGKDGSAPAKSNGETGVYGRAAAGFMGQKWDTGETAFDPAFWAEVLRVLKPGAHVLAFGGTRTYHRLAVAIEDAGFEIRDAVMWHYGSGFPKSHDVSKGIDRAASVERTEVVGIKPGHEGFANRGNISSVQSFKGTMGGEGGFSRPWMDDPEAIEQYHQKLAPATDAAREWEGWGTALKPATEIIVLARKPLSERTVAANVLRWGTGALNIDACRVEIDPTVDDPRLGGKGTWSSDKMAKNVYEGGYAGIRVGSSEKGRWPANLIHDGSEEVLAGLGDSARFFYCAKANKRDRCGSKHPTVKPINLIQYLIRLITSKGGTVLDPFAGSGTTGEAAIREGCKGILIEREASYFADIENRLQESLMNPTDHKRKTTNESTMQIDYEKLARQAGWIAEKEYNGEDDGVRSENGENWAENWEGACRQDGLIPDYPECDLPLFRNTR